MPKFENKHLSYSRLSRFEQCPLSFKLSYIDKKRTSPGVPLLFGKAIHDVLEHLVQEHMDNEREDALSEKRALELWQEAWSAGGLTGAGVFEEGIKILKNFVNRQGFLDHQDVLAVERRFELRVGSFNVLGFIDRVDRVDDQTVEVIDYKTNRMLFTREEIDHSLQMSIYHLAARELWPWAKKVRLSFDMLRHGVRLTTERSDDQLEAAKRYIETTGRMTEEAGSFPAHINSNCQWCDHQTNCHAYALALKGGRGQVCNDLKNIESVAQEREDVTNLAKLLYSRKRELEDVLKAGLREKDELVLNGVRYRMLTSASKSYPLKKTLSVLSSVTGKKVEELASRVAIIDKKALEGLVKEVKRELSKQEGLMLRAELDAISERKLSQRFSAKVIPV